MGSGIWAWMPEWKPFIDRNDGLGGKCMKYDFDKVVDRHGTNCLKYDFTALGG